MKPLATFVLITALSVVTGCFPAVQQLTPENFPTGPDPGPTDNSAGTPPPFATFMGASRNELVYNVTPRDTVELTATASQAAQFCWPRPGADSPIRLVPCDPAGACGNPGTSTCDVLTAGEVFESCRCYRLVRAPLVGGQDQTVKAKIVPLVEGTETPDPHSDAARIENATLRLVRPPSPLTVSVEASGQAVQGQELTVRASIRGGQPYGKEDFACFGNTALDAQLGENPSYCVIWEVDKCGLQIAPPDCCGPPDSCLHQPLAPSGPLSVNNDTGEVTATFKLNVPDDVGVLQISAQVNDAAGNTVSEFRSIVVVPEEALRVVATVGASTIVPGATTAVTVQPAGGTPPYKVSVLPQGLAGTVAGGSASPVKAGGTANFTYTAPLANANGLTDNLVVSVADAGGAVVKSTLTVFIASNFDVSISASPVSLVLKETSVITVSVQNGLDHFGVAPPVGQTLYKFEFSGSGLRGSISPATVNTNSPTVTATYTAPASSAATDILRVVVTDVSGRSVTRDVALVTTDSALTVDIQSTAVSLSLGDTVTLTATPHGALGTPTYVWEVSANPATLTQNGSATAKWIAAGVAGGAGVTFTVTLTDPGRSPAGHATASFTVVVGALCGIPALPATLTVPPLVNCVCPGKTTFFQTGAFFATDAPGTAGQTFYGVVLDPSLNADVSVFPAISPPGADPSEPFTAGSGILIQFNTSSYASLGLTPGSTVQYPSCTLLVRDQCRPVTAGGLLSQPFALTVKTPPLCVCP